MANVNKKVQKETVYQKPVYDEIKLIIVLTGCVILLLSLFNLCGRWGNRIAYLLFGVFGSTAYILPFALFFAISFHMVNKGSALARIKIIAGTLFFIILTSLIALNSLPKGNIKSVKDAFLVCAAAHSGGGAIGNAIAMPLFSGIGQLGANIILGALLIIAFVLVTGRGVFIRLGHIMYGLAEQFKSRYDEYREQRGLESYSDIDPDDDLIEEDEPDAVSMASELSGTKRKKTDIKTAKKKTVSDDFDDIDDEEDVKLSGFRLRQKEKAALKKTEEREVIHEAPASDDLIIKKDVITDIDSDDDVEAALRELTSSSIEFDPAKKAESMKKTEPARTARRKPQGLKVEIPEFLRDRQNIKLTDETVSEEAAAETEEAAGDTSEKVKTGAAAEPAGESAVKSASVEISIDEKKEEQKYIFPPIGLLEEGSGNKSESGDLMEATAEKLQSTFDSFGVGVTVTDATCGPTVTRYEILPDAGVKVNSIKSLSDDIKLSLAVEDIRIEAPIPGKSAVGIEVPNSTKEMVRLRSLLESREMMSARSKLCFAAGKDIEGRTVVANIEKMPHLLIAGATGSGKSVCINTIIMSLLFRADPKEVKLLMIDPKVVELNVYNGLPHMLIPVVTDPKKAAGSLNWAVQTMMERYQKFASLGAKDIKSYNERVSRMPEDETDHRYMPQILIIIDELADLMMVAKAEVEDAIVRLSQLARAAGIHLVIATQRPSVNVITGLIKANVPSRIAFAVSSGVDSRTILDMNGAEKLLGNGDMLFYPQGYSKPVRVQGAFVSDDEIARVTDFIKAHAGENEGQDEEIARSIDSSASGIGSSSSASSQASSGGSDRDVYFEEAGRFVIEKEKASIGMLQRVYKIGFNRAARIVDQLCDAGVVGPEIGTKPRQILMTIDEFENYLKEEA